MRNGFSKFTLACRKIVIIEGFDKAGIKAGINMDLLFNENPFDDEDL